MTFHPSDLRKMAHEHNVEADEHEKFDRPNRSKFHRTTAAMLREYAEGVEVDDAMVERACLAAIETDQATKETWLDPSYDEERKSFRIGMRAALTAALSEREGEK